MDSMFATTGLFGALAVPRRGVLLLAYRAARIPSRHLAGYAGILQADAYGGLKHALTKADPASPGRKGRGSITEVASCGRAGQLFEALRRRLERANKSSAVILADRVRGVSESSIAALRF